MGIAWGLLGLTALVALLLDLAIVPASLPRAAPSDWPVDAGSRVAWALTGVLLAVAAAATAWTGTPPGRRSGTHAAPALAVLAAAWAALVPAVWSDYALLQRSALVLTCLVPGALVHLTQACLAATSPGRHLWDGAVPTAYLVLGGLGTVHALSRDPFLDPGCLVGCWSQEPLLDVPGAALWSGTAVRVSGVLAALLSAGVAVGALRRAESVRGRATILAILACTAAETTWALPAEARAGLGPRPFDQPQALMLRSAAWALLALALVVDAALTARRRAALRQMAREIVEVTPPRSMRDVVARRLGDSGAQLAFLVEGAGWVDERGRPVSAERTGAQAAVLRRSGRVVARLSLDSARVRARDIEDALGPATLLALEAERTRAEVLLRLDDLREQRRREVAARDAARRAAERDLHDGAQHLLLAATFALREGIQLADGSGDRRLGQVLERACAKVSDGARELRVVAHGLYPVLLNDAGLVAALEGLARESTAVTTLDATPVGRAEPSTELTAYLAAVLVVRATRNGEVHLTLTRHGDHLILLARGAEPPPEQTRPLADRAVALGGTLEIVDGSLRLELPCA